MYEIGFINSFNCIYNTKIIPNCSSNIEKTKRLGKYKTIT